MQIAGRSSFFEFSAQGTQPARVLVMTAKGLPLVETTRAQRRDPLLNVLRELTEFIIWAQLVAVIITVRELDNFLRRLELKTRRLRGFIDTAN